MRKVVRRIGCLVMICALAMSMAACGGKKTTDSNSGSAGNGSGSGGSSQDEADSGNGGNGDSSQDETDSGNSDKEEDSSGSDGQMFHIGGIGPTTGDASIYGLAVKNAAEIAIKEINEAGGINGYQIAFDFQDDESNPEKAVNAYNTLKDWGMQLLLGTVTSDPCIAVAEQSKNDNLYQLTPSGSATECVQYDNAFRVCFSDPNQGAGAAAYIGEKNLGSKVAVIYDSSITYSTGIYETFMKGAESQPFEVVAVEAFTSESNKDFSVQLQKAKDAGADLVFLPIYYTEASLILAQADTMGYAPKFFGCDGMDGLLAIENFDTSYAENLMFMTPFLSSATDEKTTSFVSAYEAVCGEVPNQFAADAYDGIYIMKAAMEKAGVTPDMSVSDICDALKDAMTKITYDGLTGTGITWGADGEPNKTPNAVIIKNGEYTAME